MASPASPGFGLSKCAARQASRPPPPTRPRPNTTDLPLAWEEGGHLASGSRGPWSRGVKGSPSSHHSSSSAVLLGPSRAPPHPQPRRASSRDPQLATFRLRVTARPLLRFHEGEVAGEGRIYRLGPERGRPGRGPVGPSSLAPNRLWPADSGPTGWLLVANVIWGRLGGTPPSSKNRFWMDKGSSQSETEQGRAPPRPGPLLRSVQGGGASGKCGARGDGNWQPAAPRAADARVPAPPAQRPGLAVPLWVGPRRGVRARGGCFGAGSVSLSLWPSGRLGRLPAEPARALGPRSILKEKRLYLVLGHGASPAASPPSARSRVLLGRWLSPDGTGLNKVPA